MPRLQEAERLEALATQIRICVQCPLHATRTKTVPGEGAPSARVMLIGEAPGREEDQRGQPFVGAAGRFLDEMLAGSGVDRRELFITNTVKCRPENNRPPRKREVDTCTSLYLFEQIELINPALIMVLGSVATKKLLGVNSVNEVRGRVIEHNNRKYLAGYHPAASFYREDMAENIRQDFALLRQELQKLAPHPDAS
jgi:uracil-DNA glycosylase family 4